MAAATKDTAQNASPKNKQQRIPRRATEADARKYRIPSGHSMKHWGPHEEPVCILFESPFFPSVNVL
jgi:hypothetical protein